MSEIQNIDNGNTYNESAGDGNTYNESAGDGNTYNGTAGGGNEYNGTAGDGNAYNGTAGEGNAYNGTAGEGTTYNGNAFNGTVDNGTTYNGNTDTKGKNTNNKNVIWGAIFLIGALALLVNKLGFLNILLGGMSFFQIIATVFLVWVLVKGMAKHSFGQILFSVAFIIIVNDKVLHMEAFTPWTVLGAALLGTIGLHLMFPNVKSGWRPLIINGKEIVPVQTSKESRQGVRVHYENTFGESVKYVSGEISRVKMENVFGSVQIYFTDALLMDGTADVVIANTFGSIVLYIPADWKVVMNVNSVFGGSSQKGQCNPAGSSVLYVKGESVFGSVQVRYI